MVPRPHRLLLSNTRALNPSRHDDTRDKYTEQMRRLLLFSLTLIHTEALQTGLCSNHLVIVLADWSESGEDTLTSRAC